MSWDTVKENINLNGYTDDQADAIMEGFREAYEGSARARQMLDQVTEDNPMEITFRQDAAFAAPRTGTYAGEGFLTRGIYWDPDQVNQISIIDDTGTVGTFTEQYVLLHEAVHLIEGEKDLDEADRANGKHYTGFRDYLGETERVTKEMLDELGVDMQRVSYASAGPRFLLTPGTEYTNNESIDAAIVTGGSPVYTDQFMRDGRDLVVGIGGRDLDIRTGDGRDFVRTAAGDDTINAGRGNDDVQAGAGNDSMVEGSGNDVYDGGAGIDRIDLTPRGTGPVAVVAGEGGLTFTRERGMFRDDEVDKATNVEIVTAPAGVQTARIEGLEATSYLDMGAGRDRVDLSTSLDDAYVLDLRDGIIPAGQPGAGEAYTATVSDGSKTLYLGGVADDDITDSRTPTPDASAAPEVEQDIGTQEISVEQAMRYLAEDEKDPRVRDAMEAEPEEADRLIDTYEGLMTAGETTVTVPDPLPEPGPDRFRALAEAGIAKDAELAHERANAATHDETSQDLARAHEDEHDMAL